MHGSALAPRTVFVAGGTGYVGGALVPRLIARGHRVLALVRPGSAARLAPGAEAVLGDALDAASFGSRIAPADTFVQLVGVPHPSPAKAAQFRAVDLVSARASIAAARAAGVSHFVYVSVAQPAPVMKAYQAVRAECEATLRASGMHATILRPWYILGPGHVWPYALWPAYRIAELVPPLAAGARRLGLLRLEQFVEALVVAVESPPRGVRVVEVPELREARAQLPARSAS